jgi:hypothetical protein
MDRIREGYQGTISWGRKNSIIYRAKAAPADPNEVKPLDWLDGLRRQGGQNSKPFENILAVGLDGFAPKSRWRTRLSLQDEDGNRVLRKRQTKNRPAASRPYYYDVTFPCQSGTPHHVRPEYRKGGSRFAMKVPRPATL